MKIALWTAATMLLLAGTVIYLVWDTSWAWWLYGLTMIPFVILAGRKLKTDDVDFRHGGFTDGPWGPP